MLRLAPRRAPRSRASAGADRVPSRHCARSACRERSGASARPRGPSSEQPRQGLRADKIRDQNNRRYSPDLQASAKLISFSGPEPRWGWKPNLKSGDRSSRIARLEARYALGIVVDDAAQAGIASLGVHARFERRHVLTLRIAPGDPLGLRVIERAAPTGLLRGQQALARVERL